MISGILKKMRTELASPVRYHLTLGERTLLLNDYLGKQITLHFTGAIFCIQCGKKTSKSFQQGHCFPCMQRINECDNCILHPERCHVEMGTCPQDDWAHEQCAAAHYVYLANSSGLKIGITRHTQLPYRWIDQGAVAALPIFKVPNRRQAGLIELIFKKHVNDKTNWRAMLKNCVPSIDLKSERDRLWNLTKNTLSTYQWEHEFQEPMIIDYPVLNFPSKIVAHSLDKNKVLSGVLEGIKGQYLILDTGVFNVRKFGGYQVNFEL